MFLQTTRDQTAAQKVGKCDVTCTQQRQQHVRMRAHCAASYAAQGGPYLGQGLQGAAPKPYMRSATPKEFAGQSLAVNVLDPATIMPWPASMSAGHTEGVEDRRSASKPFGTHTHTQVL